MRGAFPQQQDEDFNLTTAFGGYISKPELTNTSPAFLVAGSQNVLVDYANRIISRNGYKLYNQPNTGGNGIKGSYDWLTSTGSQFSLRAYDHTLEFDWEGAYNTLLTGLRTPVIEFAKVLDYNEQQDVLLFVLGEANMRRWSGGVSKVWKSTSSTLTKQGVLGVQTTQMGSPTISVASPAVVTLTAHGLSVGDIVQFSSTGALPSGISPGVNYYVISAGLDANDFEISLSSGGAAVNTTGTQSGTHTLYKLNTANALGISFVAGTPGTIAPTILDANSNFLNAGFAAGDTLFVTGSANNDSNFTIGSVTANSITLIMSDVLVSEAAGQLIIMYNQTGPTWKSARFLSTISGRSIVYQGISYAYTGGENTDTLTGLSAFPAVSAGDPVWQASDIIPLPSSITSPFPLFYPDLIGVQLNIVSLASTKSQMTFGSETSDYTNFTLTDPRASGDPYQQPLTDGCCTCIVPVDSTSDTLNTLNTLVFGSGLDSFDQIDFHMSQDNTQELLRIVRYKTAKGAGLISKGAICPIKGTTVYISREPALDTLSSSSLESPEGKKNVPISDPIKTDFDTYDFTSAHLIYWKRALYIALPAHGLVLIYDMMRSLWQPPQTIPVSRLAIINDQLYGHSSIANETYQLFTGTNDNGVGIPQIARFAYNNGGTRQRLKNLSEYWTDGYITANGELDYTIYFGYGGANGTASMTILGNDAAVVDMQDATPIGDEQFGEVPFGGSPFNPINGLPGAGTPLQRFMQIDTASPNDYAEHFVEYRMNTMDAQFALVAHGSDMFDAGTAMVSRKK